MKNSLYAGMNGYNSTPGDMFDRARTQIDTPFQYLDIDLSVARNNQIIVISGDFLFADLSTNGTAVIELNNQQDASECPIMFAAGMAFHAPFKQIKITNTAQAAAKMRLLYSTGYSIIPSSSMANINQILQPVNINDVISSSCQLVKTTGVFTAGATVTNQILTPANNVNGAIIRSLFSYIYSGAGGNGCDFELIAAPTQPSGNGSAASSFMLQAISCNQTTQTFANANSLSKRIPAGWGIWMFAYQSGPTPGGFGNWTSLELL